MLRAYDAERLIRNASDGNKYLYDVVNIKKNTASAIDLSNKETRKGSDEAATRGGASGQSVPQYQPAVKQEKHGRKADSRNGDSD